MKYKQPKIFDVSKRESTLLDLLATRLGTLDPGDWLLYFNVVGDLTLFLVNF